MKDRDEWMRLCAQAAIAGDLEAFIYVSEQIKKLLAEKELRLYSEQTSDRTRRQA